MTAPALPLELTEFRCAACGYGISVSGALPACPMCRTTTWEPNGYTIERSSDESSDENR